MCRRRKKRKAEPTKFFRGGKKGIEDFENNIVETGQAEDGDD
jgi:hypothetical protein